MYKVIALGGLGEGILANLTFQLSNDAWQQFGLAKKMWLDANVIVIFDVSNPEKWVMLEHYIVSGE